MVTRVMASAQGAKLAGEAAQQAAGKVARTVQRNVKRAVVGTLGLVGERMTKVDTAWLRMDCDANLMMIVGVWQLSPGVKYAAVCERIENTLLRYDRFRQRVLEDTGGATWVEDRNFDLRNHVVLEKLPKVTRGQHQQEALQDRVAGLATQRLDPKRPLWQIHLIEDYTGPDGVKGSAMIVRIHHCIADGIALISVTMSLVDGGVAPPERVAKSANGKSVAHSAEDWITDTLLKPFTDISVKALGAVGDGAARSLGMLGDPDSLLGGIEKGFQKGIEGSIDMAKVLYQLASDSAALALMPDDSKTRLKGKPGGQKKVAWCQPIPLEDVKAVGKALNCSINDVLLSCVAGALGEYLKSFGDDVTGQEIRAMVPVNLRPTNQSNDQTHKLGNRFGLAPLVLPIGLENPIERVYEVRKRMSALKGSYQPLLAFGLLAVAGLLIKPAQDMMLNLFARKTTAVMTNVPGPRDKLKFCGATLEQSMFWVPQSGDVGLGVSILSYGGGVQFGVITDSLLCPEPQQIIDEFMPEFARLSIVTLMLPWGDD